jgi:hypothetical protein
MRLVGLTLTGALMGLVIVSVNAQSPATGQKPAAARPVTAKPAAIPRLADGRPDLQGNWTNATITPLERLRPNTPLVISEEAALDEEKKTRAAIEFREQDSDPNRAAPPVGGRVARAWWVATTRSGSIQATACCASTASRAAR